jgi:hypothetical protein
VAIDLTLERALKSLVEWPVGYACGLGALVKHIDSPSSGVQTAKSVKR